MNILTIGDSVVWGQGLVDPHKFARLVGNAFATTLEFYAHSGAIIGAHNTRVHTPVPGEVPICLPSILQQLTFCKQPTDVDLVVLNGGINDVTVGRILSPWTTIAQLDASVKLHCGSDMLVLLTQVGQQITKPGARVVVLGYYPILSSDSQYYEGEHQLAMLLEVHGVATGSFALNLRFRISDLLPAIIANCMEFWQQSNSLLQGAVNQANTAFPTGPKFIFVPTPFTEQNSVFASHPLLWGIKPDLSPEDEVSAVRGPQCDAVYGDVLHLPKLLECQRASAGHPNEEGAASIAKAIMSALQ